MSAPKIAFLFETGWVYITDEGCVYVAFDKPLTYHFCPNNHAYTFEAMVILYRELHFPVILHDLGDRVQYWTPDKSCPVKEAPTLSGMIAPIADAFGDREDLDGFLWVSPVFESLLRRMPEGLIPK